MAAASDKARFYIEQTVPDLREWERRQIFTKDEIISLNSQRTGYETQLNSREASPALFIRYLTYESNVSLLLSKRLSRRAVPPKPVQKLRTSQQKRLFQILDRATTRFKSDLGLWAQYLHFCREQAAVKRGQRVLTECLRLFPTRPEVWGYAAGWAEGSGDLSGARSYYLRGLRFCGDTQSGKDLYIRFARAEMRWVGDRRRALGVDNPADGEMKAFQDEEDGQEERKSQEEADLIAIEQTNLTPANTSQQDAADVLSSGESEGFHRFSSTPAMTGAIPIAVYDQAMKAYQHSPDLAETFFDMFAQFQGQPCTLAILRHIVGSIVEAPSQDAAVLQSCQCRMHLMGVSVDSAEFPGALRKVLAEIKSSQRILEKNLVSKRKFNGKVTKWLLPVAQDLKLVPELKTILDDTIHRLAPAQEMTQAHE